MIVSSSFELPKISIVIATLNSEKYLERCLDSIVSQRYSNYEIIIKDGGSNDQTIEIIKKNENYIYYWESTSDKGIYDAWNHALLHCRGEWICFLGADDFFINCSVLKCYSNFLSKIDTNRHIVTYGINQVVNIKGDLLYTIGSPWKQIERSFNNYMCLPHPGMMHHQSLFKINGFFNPSYQIAGDYELLLRVFKTTKPAFWPNIVCATPIGGISTIPINNLKCLIEIQRAQKRNSINRISWHAFRQWISALIRLCLWHAIGEEGSHKLFNFVRKKRRLPTF